MDEVAGERQSLSPPAARRPPSGRPRAFAGVFSATLLCFLAIGAVLPILPKYVSEELGAGNVAVGVVVGAFAISALVGRPVGGRLADRRGRRTVHMAGMAICVVAGLLLFVPFGVPGLIFARLVVGLGDGWVFTAGVTWIVDLSPGGAPRTGDRDVRARDLGRPDVRLRARRGRLLARRLRRRLGAGRDRAAARPARRAHRPRGRAAASAGERGARRGRARHGDLAAAAAVAAAPAATAGFERFVPREALRPGAALALANVGYGTMAGFVVLLLDQQGIGHGATAFTVFAGSVVAARLLLGRLPDILGARRTALGAGLVQGVGLVAVGLAQSLPAALAAAALMGAGMSLLFPSLALLVVDRVPDERRGAAMGAFTAFFDLGVGLGAPFAGLVASLAGGEYAVAFYVAGACCVGGAFLGWFSTRGIQREPVLA